MSLYGTKITPVVAEKDTMTTDRRPDTVELEELDQLLVAADNKT